MATITSTADAAGDTSLGGDPNAFNTYTGGYSFTPGSDGSGSTRVTVLSTPAAPSLTAASDTGISDSDRLTRDKTPTFTGSVDAGSTVTLYDNGTAVGTARANASGAYTVAASRRTDGMHKFTVAGTDAAGNSTPSSAITYVTIDTKAPYVEQPVLSKSSDTGVSSSDGITKSTTLYLSGMADPGSTVTLFDGTTEIATTPAGDAGVYDFTCSDVTQGAHSYRTAATDPAGNTSQKSAATTVTVDTTAPAAPSRPVLSAAYDTGVSSTDGITRSTTLVLTGTAEAGAALGLYVNGQLGAVSTAAANGTYRFSGSGATQGTRVYSVAALDKAGNLGPQSASSTVTVDTTAPATPTAPKLSAAYDTGASSVDGITRSTTLFLTGTAEAGTTVTLYDGGTGVGSAVAGQDGAYSVRLSGVTDGRHIYRPRATDAAGNVSGATSYTAVTVDTSAPATPPAPKLSAASDTGASSTDGITRSTTLQLTGTAEAGATVTLYDGSTGVGSAVARQDGTYSLKLNGVAERRHTYRTRASDTAGNVSGFSTYKTVTVDRTAPDVDITSAGGTVASARQTITGTGEVGTIVTLEDNGTAVGTATVGSNGTWRKAITLSGGQNTIMATDTDAAGNAGASAAVTYNCTPPARQMAFASDGPAAPTGAPDTGQSSLAQALFDATFSPASSIIAPTHAAAVAHPVLAVPD